MSVLRAVIASIGCVPMAGINSSWPSSASYIRRAHRHVYDQSVFVSCVKSFAAADAVLTFERRAATHEAISATHCRDERAQLEVFFNVKVIKKYNPEC